MIGTVNGYNGFSNLGGNMTWATTGTVTFAGGATTATITIDPTADTFLEFDDTIVLSVVAGVGYDIVPTQGVATGTITTDETVNIGLDDHGRLMIRDSAGRKVPVTEPDGLHWRTRCQMIASNVRKHR